MNRLHRSTPGEAVGDENVRGTSQHVAVLARATLDGFLLPLLSPALEDGCYPHVDA